MKVLSISNNNYRYNKSNVKPTCTNQLSHKGSNIKCVYVDNAFKEKHSCWQNIIEKLVKKLSADPLFKPEEHHLNIKWLETIKRHKTVADGCGIIGVKEPSLNPYYPTKFNYGTIYKTLEVEDEKLEVTLIDPENWDEVTALNAPWNLRPGNSSHLVKCDFIYNSERSTDQIAEDFYNTYKHLRHEKYYKK